jgi:hypothetical protein
MKIKDLLNNYTLLKKSYRKKNQLKKIFNINYNSNINSFFSKPFFFLLAVLSPISLVWIAANYIQQEIDLIIFLGAFITYIGGMISFTHFLEKKQIKKYKSSYLPSLIQKSVYSFFFNKNKIHSIFKKHLNKKEKEIIKDIDNLTFEFKKRYIKEYIENNKKPFYLDIESHYINGSCYSNKQTISLFNIITFIFEEISIEELNLISNNKIEKIINDFSLEEQLSLTNLLAKRIQDNNNNVEEIESKKKQIKNNLKFFENENNTLNITNKNTEQTLFLNNLIVKKK